jgi:hypothetical protein
LSKKSLCVEPQSISKIFASDEKEIPPGFLDDGTRHFQGERLRHKIAIDFARACLPKVAEHARADWPGESPCPH